MEGGSIGKFFPNMGPESQEKKLPQSLEDKDSIVVNVENDVEASKKRDLLEEAALKDAAERLTAELVRKFGVRSVFDEEIDGRVITREEKIERYKGLVKKFYGTEDVEGIDALVYHTIAHSESVARNANEILLAIQGKDPSLVNDDDFKWTLLRALSHDIEQHGYISLAQRQEKVSVTQKRPSSIPREIREIDAPSGEFGMRQRMLGLNEEWSAEYLEKLLRKYKGPDGEKIFDLTDESVRKQIEDPIAATTPGFEFVAEVPEAMLDKYGLDKTIYGKGLKISQPKLHPDSSLMTFALATGDLRGEFRRGKGGEAFIMSGNREFEELHSVEVKRVLENIVLYELGKKTITEIEPGIDRLSSAMIKWMRTQVVFPLHQEFLFEQSLQENNILKDREDLKNVIREQYDFAPAVGEAKARYERITDQFKEKLSIPLPHYGVQEFEQLLGELGLGEEINKIKMEIKSSILQNKKSAK